MRCLFFLLTLGLIGCATAQLAPESIRQKNYNKAILDKNKSFDKAIDWIAVNFDNSKKVVRVQDKERGKIILKGNVSCNALNLGNGYANKPYLDFTMEVSFETKNVVVQAQDIVAKAISSAWDSGQRPINKDEADKAFAECIDPVIKNLFDVL